MARGVNKAILLGNIGKDPETRYFPSGDAVTTATLATSETWKDKQSGEMKEATEWHNLVFPGKLAEIAGKYLKKGSKVYVEGSIRTRKWEKDGQTRYTTEIRVGDMQMLDGKPADSNGRGESRREDGYSRSHSVPPQGEDTGGFEDDSIPF